MGDVVRGTHSEGLRNVATVDHSQFIVFEYRTCLRKNSLPLKNVSYFQKVNGANILLYEYYVFVWG